MLKTEIICNYDIIVTIVFLGPICSFGWDFHSQDNSHGRRAI